MMGWNYGVPVGTGTILNFGNELQATISGSVLQVDVTGSTMYLAVDGTRLISYSASGTFIVISNSPDPRDNIGIMGWSSGTPLRTGTILNVRGALFTISGTTLDLFITGTLPLPHATTHLSGGYDAIPLDLLAPPNYINNYLDANTGTHGLMRKLSGDGGKYIGGDGLEHDLPGVVSYFMANVVSTITGTYRKLLPTNPTGTETNMSVGAVSATGSMLPNIFVSSSGAVTFLPAQTARLYVNAAITTGTKNAHIYGQVYRYTEVPTAELLLGTTVDQHISTVELQYELPVAIPDTFFGANDRVELKLFAIPEGPGNTPTVTIYFDGLTASRLEFGTNSVQGPVGPAGPTGAVGPQGPTGATGPAGPAGTPLLGVMGWSAGVPLGTGTVINFRNFASASISGTVLDVNPNINTLLFSNTTYYVGPAGNDSNDGLTPATAWATVGHAPVVFSALDANGFSITIQLMSGTVTDPTLANGISFSDVLDCPQVSVQGYSPSTTTWNTQNLVTVTARQTVYTFSEFLFGGSRSASLQFLSQSKGSYVNVVDLAFRSSIGFPFSVDERSTLFLSGTISVAQANTSLTYFANVINQSLLVDYSTVVYGGNTFSNSVFSANNLSVIQQNSWFLSGTATGQPFRLQNNSIFYSLSGVLPNNNAGIVSVGSFFVVQSPSSPTDLNFGRGNVYAPTGVNVAGHFAAFGDANGNYLVDGGTGTGGGGGTVNNTFLGMFGENAGIPLGTGTILNVNGTRLVMTISGTTLNLSNSPDPVEMIGVFGANQGTNLGTGTTLSVTGSRLSMSLVGTTLNLTSSPDPTDNIGVMGWQAGAPIGTGTVINFRGSPPVIVSLSGTVLDVFVTGNSIPAPVFGFYGENGGIALGTGTILNVNGTRLVATISGTTINLSNSPDPQELIGVFGVNQGTNLGTGTTLSVTGSRLSMSLVGSVLNLTSSPDPAPVFGVMGWDEGTPLGTGTVLNVVGSRLSYSISGTVLQILSSPDPVDNIGMMFQHLGTNLGTGTVLNVIGSIQNSGTTFELRVPKVLPLIPGALNNGAWPAADTRISGSYVFTDLVGYSQARLMGRWGANVPPTVSGAFVHVQYNTNMSTGGAFSELASNPQKEGRLYWRNSINVQSNWFNIDPAAAVDQVVLLGWSSGGNGTRIPEYAGTILIEFR